MACLLLAAGVLLGAGETIGREPQEPDAAGCGDRVAHVHRKAKHGVQEESLTLCDGDRIRWRELTDENWEIHFKVSPFVNGEKDFKRGETDPSPLKHVKGTKVYRYRVVVDSQEFDPQIIVKGR